jgi:hypothetical protein
MVMIGYEAGTKAYRAYNLVNKKLVVTRDVLFEEAAARVWEEGNAKVAEAGLAGGVPRAGARRGYD